MFRTPEPLVCVIPHATCLFFLLLQFCHVQLIFKLCVLLSFIFKENAGYVSSWLWFIPQSAFFLQSSKITVGCHPERCIKLRK